MSVKEIEEAVTRLTPEDLAQFSAWFEEYQAQAWDEQIARDARAGRFDQLIERAREQYEVGQRQFWQGADRVAGCTDGSLA